MDTVTELCKKLGIELRPPNGQPFHCGQHMDVHTGIVGADYAECKICGLAIGNIASPHVTGIIFQINDEITAGRTWTRLDTPPIEQPETSDKEQETHANCRMARTEDDTHQLPVRQMQELLQVLSGDVDTH